MGALLDDNGYLTQFTVNIFGQDNVQFQSLYRWERTVSHNSSSTSSTQLQHCVGWDAQMLSTVDSGQYSFLFQVCRRTFYFLFFFIFRQLQLHWYFEFRCLQSWYFFIFFCLLWTTPEDRNIPLVFAFSWKWSDVQTPESRVSFISLYMKERKVSLVA